MLKKSAALLDQVVVSGGNFILTILIARTLPLDDFGFFSISWLIVISVAALIQALFIAPMLSLTPQFSKVEQKKFSSLLFFELILTLVTLFLIISCAYVITKNYNISNFTTILFGFLLLSIPYYLYEFLRRYLMLRGENIFLLICDVLCYGLMLVSIYLFDSIDLTSVFIIISMSFTCAIFLLSFKLDLDLFKIIKEFNSYSYMISKQHNFSKWLVISSILQFFNGNAYILVTGYFIGVTQVAYLKMAQNIIGVINPIYVFLDNHAQLYLAKIRFEKSIEACDKAFLKITIICMSCLFLLLLSIYIFRENIIYFVYGEQPVDVYDYLLLMLLLSAFTGANFLQRLIVKIRENTKVIFKSYVYSSVVSFIAVYPLITLYGGIAAVQAMIIAQAVMLLTLHYSKNEQL
jgi:O-antigen/teichoic acid export membrane protein